MAVETRLASNFHLIKMRVELENVFSLRKTEINEYIRGCGDFCLECVCGIIEARSASNNFILRFSTKNSLKSFDPKATSNYRFPSFDQSQFFFFTTIFCSEEFQLTIIRNYYSLSDNHKDLTDRIAGTKSVVEFCFEIFFYKIIRYNALLSA